MPDAAVLNTARCECAPILALHGAAYETRTAFFVSTRDKAAALLALELQRLGRGRLAYTLCFSDADWRRAMASCGCPAYTARLASPTARRGTRGKLGMATICHFRHGHTAVVYIRTHGRDWPAIAETVRHEALHLARPSYSHRQVEKALRC
jgi:hypothetical protein